MYFESTPQNWPGSIQEPVFHWVLRHSGQHLIRLPAPQSSILLSHCMRGWENTQKFYFATKFNVTFRLKCSCCVVSSDNENGLENFTTYPVILWVMILTPHGDSPIALNACLMKFSSMYGSNWTHRFILINTHKIFPGLLQKWILMHQMRHDSVLNSTV